MRTIYTLLIAQLFLSKGAYSQTLDHINEVKTEVKFTKNSLVKYFAENKKFPLSLDKKTLTMYFGDESFNEKGQLALNLKNGGSYEWSIIDGSSLNYALFLCTREEGERYFWILEVVDEGRMLLRNLKINSRWKYELDF